MERSSRYFQAGPEAPREAREFVSGMLAPTSANGAADVAVLLTSELMADAVRNGDGRISIDMQLAAGGMRIEVSNLEPALVPMTPAGSLERRFAVALVDAMSSSWGSEGDRDRTSAWFELPFAPAEVEVPVLAGV